VALAAADLAPGVEIPDRNLLTTTSGEWIVEIVLPRSRLLPCVLGISKEHSQKVARARFIRIAIGRTSVHNTQIVDKLDIALLTIKLSADLLSCFFHCVDSVHLLLRKVWHARIARNVKPTQKRRLNELAHGLTLREEKGRTKLQVRSCVSVILSATYFAICMRHLLLLKLEWPLGFRHGLKHSRILLKELVVDAPERSYVLLTTITSAAIISHVHGENITRESVVVEIHLGCDLRSSKTNILGPHWNLLKGCIANMAYVSSAQISGSQILDNILNVWFA